MGIQSLKHSEEIVDGRYHLGSSLGQGGMGSVYAAYDRLTKQEVALKKISLGDGERVTSSADSYLDPRIALAQEFQVLAKLRHPNIITVLDYGFDNQNQPYFTMDLVQNPQTILEAAQNQPFQAQIKLLVQLLQALSYLHRRGFVHRDLKPGNILVDSVTDKGESKGNGRQSVKVLDLGLSIRSDESASIVGTLAYMAPELLIGKPATYQSDLFSVGVVASQMFTGSHPFGDPSTSYFLQNILHSAPNIYLKGLDIEFTTLLAKLLNQNLSKRFASATEVLSELGKFLDQPFILETASTRESFLQAAQFVGREKELATLENALTMARNKKGGGWLIAGESGVGKSRLANELRIRALVRGVLTLRSHARLGVGSPYFIWKDIVRQLLLSATIDKQEAAVLKSVFYNLDDIIDFEVESVSDLTPDVMLTELLKVIENIISQLKEPVLIILEDIQWARKESLALLDMLSRRTADLPLLIIGTFRSDEVSLQSLELSQMTLLELNRLSKAAVIQLSESMMGEAGRESRITDLLQKETEGNPYFVVEIVRALAEEAGNLSQVATMVLPEKIITGGLHNLIRRRVNKVQPDYQPLLRMTAVAGQQLDLKLLNALGPKNGVDDLEDWLTVCANAAILERQDNRWRFAHNKLQEGILAELSAADQRNLHLQIAQTLESVYLDQEEKAAQLTYHWAGAGNREKEVYYANLAGTQAINVRANHEAGRFFEQVIRGLTHLPTTVERKQLYMDVALKLSRVAAFYPSVDVLPYLQQAREYSEGLNDEVRQAHIYSSIGAYYYVRVQMSMAFEYFQKCLVLAEKLSLDSLLVLPYNLIGRAHANLGNYDQGTNLLARGIPLAEQFDDLDLLAGSLVFYGLSLAYQGMWQEAESYAKRGLTLAENLNSPERIAANKMIVGVYYAYCGYWEEAQSLLADAAIMTEEQGALQLLFVCYGTLGYVCLRTNQVEKGCDYLEQCLSLNKEQPQLSINLPMFHAYQAETLVEKEGWLIALEKVNEAIELAKTMNQPMAQAQALQSLSRILQASPKPDWTKAEQALLDAIAVYEQGNGLTYIAVCQLEIGKLYAAYGRSSEAQTVLTKAQSLFAQYEMSWYQSEADIALSNLKAQLMALILRKNSRFLIG